MVSWLTSDPGGAVSSRSTRHKCMQIFQLKLSCRSRTSTRACNGHHTHRVDYKEGGRNAFDCVSLFLTWGQLGEVFSLRFSDRRGSPYSKWESASFQRCGFLTTFSSFGFRLSLGKMTPLAVRCVVSTLTFRTWK